MTVFGTSEVELQTLLCGTRVKNRTPDRRSRDLT